ncbi:MAG TPA: hypothetical protein VKQ70_05300 [Caulobacteraceae bacterium]|jgi:hypothetical protein|nr:hypothetical protein [Caulobacteraceae bacterium]
MLALILALAIGGAAGTEENASPTGELRMDHRPPPVPPSARKQAEEAIRQGQADPASVQFRDEGVSQATSVRRSAFDPRIAGPVSIVCGRFNAHGQTGAYEGYAWFFVAIKHGEVLWSEYDQASDGLGAAYNSCKNAGLAS